MHFAALRATLGYSPKKPVDAVTVRFREQALGLGIVLESRNGLLELKVETVKPTSEASSALRGGAWTLRDIGGAPVRLEIRDGDHGAASFFDAIQRTMILKRPLTLVFARRREEAAAVRPRASSAPLDVAITVVPEEEEDDALPFELEKRIRDTLDAYTDAICEMNDAQGSTTAEERREDEQRAAMRAGVEALDLEVASVPLEDAERRLFRAVESLENARKVERESRLRRLRLVLNVRRAPPSAGPPGADESKKISFASLYNRAATSSALFNSNSNNNNTPAVAKNGELLDLEMASFDNDEEAFEEEEEEDSSSVGGGSRRMSLVSEDDDFFFFDQEEDQEATIRSLEVKCRAIRALLDSSESWERRARARVEALRAERSSRGLAKAEAQRDLEAAEARSRDRRDASKAALSALREAANRRLRTVEAISNEVRDAENAALQEREEPPLRLAPPAKKVLIHRRSSSSGEQHHHHHRHRAPPFTAPGRRRRRPHSAPPLATDTHRRSRAVGDDVTLSSTAAAAAAAAASLSCGSQSALQTSSSQAAAAEASSSGSSATASLGCRSDSQSALPPAPISAASSATAEASRSSTATTSFVPVC